jgi:hypothetical protein
MNPEVDQLAAEPAAKTTTQEVQAPEFHPTFVIPHAERVVTIMGVTGAIGSLFNLCPVPHDQMTQEQVDNFVARWIEQDEIKDPEEEPEQETEEEAEAKLEPGAKKKLK